MQRILIVGGGFAGIRTALDLSKRNLPNTKITLISNKHHFEYTPALYKLAVGRSPLEMCIPLSEIFRTRKVDVIIDTITGGDTAGNFLVGKSGSHYKYDQLVLALGSETSYFNIPGIAENSFPLKSVNSALRIKHHLHELFDNHKGLTKGQLMSQFHFVIVGGGPSGVELAGEIRGYARKLAKKHEVPLKYVTVTILQAAPRLLPTMSEEVSKRVMNRLNTLGINIILGKAVTSEDPNGVYLKDIQFNAKTIIWTAGVRANHIYADIKGLTLDPKGGRIIVSRDLRAEGLSNVFVLGDSAATPNAGTAQTAIYDGHYVVKALSRLIKGKPTPCYTPRKTPYVVPVGYAWAVFTYKTVVLSGKMFWVLRELIDFRFFLSILPLDKAYMVWREGGMISESCPTCQQAEKESLT